MVQTNTYVYILFLQRWFVKPKEVIKTGAQILIHTAQMESIQNLFTFPDNSYYYLEIYISCIT